MQEEDNIERVRSIPQIPEDIGLQKIAWKIQKVCWVIIVVVMLLIAAGVFGNGPLSNVREIKKNITVEYERFSRHKGEIKTTIHLTGVQQHVNVSIPVTYLSAFKLETVFPGSYESKIESGAVLYTFDSGNSTSLTIHFFAHPEKSGLIRGNWIVNKAPFQLTHFIYP